MICSSANWCTISQIAFCSSVLSWVAVAMPASVTRGANRGRAGDLVHMAYKISKALTELAMRQWGNVTRAQLLAVGLTDRQIAYRVRAGLLYRVYPRVYAVGRPPKAPLERAAAAVLACGDAAALSHSSAMTLWASGSAGTRRSRSSSQETAGRTASRSTLPGRSIAAT